ncbi:TetR/AcrR family transcriptional regulator [Zhihengliuella flava]|uniref:AcrR family transcriptional regulator n=1 Tax=Zhihengliuella flava TaxID=1285193 RepID=A0A931DCN4_9MICC|nr:TetR/AcrR family transcriptional regulator [Zhihengliuella flava]MBG6084330.1 AcrR family transcriptional regulator [Zhihengliuella flava]
MPRPPAAREKLLAAYCEIVAGEGERAATLDAVAERAGVSKGGLLYHFKSKDALADAVIEGLHETAAADRELMAAAPEGPARYFVRGSLEATSDVDTYFNAVLRLATAQHPGATDALAAIHNEWLALIRDEVGDEAVAEAIMLIGDGLYYHAALPGAGDAASTASHFRSRVEHVLEQVEVLRAAAARQR